MSQEAAAIINLFGYTMPAGDAAIVITAVSSIATGAGAALGISSKSVRDFIRKAITYDSIKEHEEEKKKLSQEYTQKLAEQASNSAHLSLLELKIEELKKFVIENEQKKSKEFAKLTKKIDEIQGDLEEVIDENYEDDDEVEETVRLTKKKG
jgi:hypothetical protein